LSLAFEDIADELATAERQRVPVEPLTGRIEGFDLASAYAVQSIVMGRRLSAGARLVGHKVGLTNVAMQQQLGVDEPDFGRFVDDMEVPADGVVALSDLIAPRVEPEIAFVLARDLAGPGVTAGDVLAATDSVAPALEIIDSRIVDWRIKLADTVADNASSSRFVVGPRRPVSGVDLVALEGVLTRDGEIVGSGRGEAVIGDPAAAVAWLVNTLAAYGESLSAGEVVLPGALCASVPLASGRVFAASMGDLGAVTVEVVA
jgi:2-oxopent-4-enoate hydratase